MSLKILIIGMPYDKGKSGLSRYLEHVICELSKNNDVDCLMLKSDAEIFPFKSDKFKIIPLLFSSILKIPIINSLWHIFILPFMLIGKKYDAVFLPAGNRRLLSFYPLPTITTFHDFCPVFISGKYGFFHDLYALKVVPLFLNRVDQVCAISKCTAKDIIDVTKIPKEKIFTNYCGFSKLENGSDNISKVDLPSKYFLYVSRVEHPGKNHLGLMKAYEKLPHHIKEEFKLVCVGADWIGAANIHKYHKKSRDVENIYFLGHVTNKELNYCYENASLFIFPSFYEGFGLPILEAMNMSIPVICSNTSCLPEVAGDAATYFKPSNEESIIDAILSVLNDKEKVAQMKMRGINQVKKFTWQKHGETIEKKFHQLLTTK